METISIFNGWVFWLRNIQLLQLWDEIFLVKNLRMSRHPHSNIQRRVIPKVPRHYQIRRRGRHSRHTSAQYAEEIFLPGYMQSGVSTKMALLLWFLTECICVCQPNGLTYELLCSWRGRLQCCQQRSTKDFLAALVHPLWSDPTCHKWFKASTCPQMINADFLRKTLRG